MSRKHKGDYMRICMLAYTFYESDNRVRRYAETLSERGDHVEAIALGCEGQPRHETIHGVEVYRIQNREINEKRNLSYLIKLLQFLFNSAFFLTRKHVRNPYDLIHVHSIPDFEVFATLIPKLMGAKIILDIHDIVPELYSSKFKVSMDSLVFKALVLVEKASCAFADHIIIANHIWHKRVVSRSVSEDKCSVVMNYPVTKLFGKCPPVLEKGQKFRLLYPGTMSWHQGIDIAIKAFAVIKDLVTDVEFHIYGDGAEKCNLQNLVLELGLQESVIIHGGVSIDRISLIMADAGIGIEPKRNDPFSGDAFSTKILEFMMLGIPVIASRTRVHSYYFNDSVVQFFDPDDVNDLAKCMLSLITDKNLREQFTVNARTFSKEYSWDDKKDKYLNLVDSLTGKRAYPFL